ncbi:hypothetical protein BB934_45345 (plasmid) [Microvirga ossetica]|uniref:Uncharacterized protein n=1 Tax=Microvirga ossetica TaxID=1882682 RepID=A0A1B2EZU1_9HYPH|nr:hypothetical protein [Microvirga ossetica]ANY85447.1 hypothetical protein BB934_45345 [Microvirga ossetica]
MLESLQKMVPLHHGSRFELNGHLYEIEGSFVQANTPKVRVKVSKLADGGEIEPLGTVSIKRSPGQTEMSQSMIANRVRPLLGKLATTTEVDLFGAD